MRTLDAGRIDHIRDICQKAITQDSNVYPHNPNALTDRAWLAQSVLNILNGNIDEQIIGENKAHAMLPGSHERRSGPECRCGSGWDKWNEKCRSQQQTTT